MALDFRTLRARQRYCALFPWYLSFIAIVSAGKQSTEQTCQFTVKSPMVTAAHPTPSLLFLPMTHQHFAEWNPTIKCSALEFGVSITKPARFVNMCSK